jgi:IclR family pca regulon transcriptional regulator
VTEGEAPGRPAETVQSLERGLAVIRVFDADNPQMTLSDVARRSGLTRATARRILHTLVALGYMSTDGRTFVLRPRILELGYAYLSSLSLPEVALPHLENLVAAVHESSSVSVLDGTEIVYVARVATKRIMTVSISVGTRFPAYATSMGRVLLAGRPDDWLAGFLASTPLLPLTPYTLTDVDALRAELQQVRRQGWALVDQELEEGLRSIAAPLHDPSGEVVAAVNVSASARRGSTETVQAEILPGLLQAAAAIESDLRAGQPAQPVG